MSSIKINTARFKLGLIISFAITTLYPIGLFISMPASDAVTILRHELSWSLFALFFIPVGFGLMCSVLSANILSKLNCINRIIFFIGTIAIFIAVLDDGKGIPNPDRISAALNNNINFQQKALQIDKCLRDRSDCQDNPIDTSFLFIKSCITEIPFPKEIISEIKNSKKEAESKNFLVFKKE